MTIENWPIDRPIPYPDNARRLNDRAVATVVSSLKEFGWRQPIVVDSDGVIVAGHTRLLAAQQMGLAEVPVHVAADLTAAQASAYRLMDNRAQDNAEWDLALLEKEMGSLRELEIPLELSGFTQGETDRYLTRSVFPTISAEELAPHVNEEKTVTCPACGHQFKR